MTQIQAFEAVKASNGPLLLYDGDCGFCAASVQFVLRHERQHQLRFAALESEVGRQLRTRHPEVAGADTMIWVDDPAGPGERVLVRSSAALRVARYMGGVWRFAGIGVLVPRPIRDAAYDLIARHRHRLASTDRCFVPPPSVRGRFI